MEYIRSQRNGLMLLVDLNWDRFLFVGAVILALLAGSYFGSL